MPFKPEWPGEEPSLGWYVIDWLTEMLALPDVMDYEPFIPYAEQVDFIISWYAIDPVTGRRKYHRGVLGRPRGWGKSPLLGALALVEAFGDVVPDGWDANGRPVGRPWHTVTTPLVQMAAVSEKQVQNTWRPVHQMVREEAPIHRHYSFEPMEGFIALPNRGRLEPITSSATTVKGGRPVFAVLDQTEEWTRSNGGIKLANTMRANAAKVGGTTLESPNAFIPGEGSVAEGSANFHQLILEGKTREPGLLYDHREAPPDTDMSDRQSLHHGLRVAYGDASGHPDGCVIHTPSCAPGYVDLDRLIATIWDPEQDEQQSRSDFLNQVVAASDSWVSQPEWAAREDRDKVVLPDEPVVLGFDGSRGRVKGRADATALIGCRVSDGHIFQIQVWEAGPAEKDWRVPVQDVDRTVRQAFKDYNVVGMYADPSGWAPQVAQWEAEFNKQLKIRASKDAPMTVWPKGKGSQVTEHVVKLHHAILNGEMTHDGAAALSRHVLNARRRSTRTGYLLYKAYPDSPNKIDAAYATVMAWKARLEALSRGMATSKKKTGRAVFV